jgi:hypothetical protein
MTANPRAIRKHPFFTRILFKMGLMERREGVPDLRTAAQANFLVVLITLIFSTIIVVGWIGNDDYSSRAVGQAMFYNPNCSQFEVVNKTETVESFEYTIDACGDVGVYEMPRFQLN